MFLVFSNLSCLLSVKYFFSQKYCDHLPPPFAWIQVEKAFCLIRLHGYNLHDLPDGKVSRQLKI